MGTQRLLRNFTSTALPMLERLIFDFIYLFLFRWLKLCSVSVTWLLMWTGYFLICKACFDSSSRSEPSNTFLQILRQLYLIVYHRNKAMISTNKNSFPDILNVFGFYSIFAWYLEVLSITAYEDQVVGMGGVNKKSEKSVTIKRNRWWNIL